MRIVVVHSSLLVLGDANDIQRVCFWGFGRSIACCVISENYSNAQCHHGNKDSDNCIFYILLLSFAFRQIIYNFGYL